MDPRFNGEWSGSEISMVKSIIASHNANNIYADDMYKKHNHIVNDIRASFPWKKKREVIKLYVELVVKIIQPTQSGNQYVVEFNNSPVEDPIIDNINMLPSYHTNKKPEVIKMVEEIPQKKVTIPQQDLELNGRFWTTEEHRLIFLTYMF